MLRHTVVIDDRDERHRAGDDAQRSAPSEKIVPMRSETAGGQTGGSPVRRVVLAALGAALALSGCSGGSAPSGVGVQPTAARSSPASSGWPAVTAPAVPRPRHTVVVVLE